MLRGSSSYRNIVNEADIIPNRSKDRKYNPELYRIEEQIKIFSHANKIIHSWFNLSI